MSASAHAGPTGREPIRVLVVEDHTLMVDALVRRLEHDAGMSVVGVASSDTECLVLYQQSQPDLVLCDVGLRNNSSGIDLTAKLLASHPGARVLMYSGYTDHDLVQSALKAGAVGYIRKTSSIPELIECLTAALDGQTEVFDRTTMREMIGVLRSRFDRPSETGQLTPREQEVLELMVAGTTATKDIAKKLVIAPETAKTHVERIMRKMDVPNRTAAVAKAYQQGLAGGSGRRTLPTRP